MPSHGGSDARYGGSPTVYEYAILQLGNYLIPATILLVLALGLDLQWGKTGLFNAGVAAFFGVGAYVFALLSTGRAYPSGTSPGHWGPAIPIDLIPATLVAMVAAGALGVLIAIPTLRLRADYLAIATLALAEIVRLFLKNERRITGGDTAVNLIPRPFDTLISRGWTSDGVFILVAAVIAVGVLIAIEFVSSLPWGRALRAVREDEEAAQALGKDTFRLKLTSFGLGCAIMGLAGALEASYLGNIVPDIFVPALTFNAFVVVILGGSGNPRGVVLGAYVFSLLGWGTQQARVYVAAASEVLAFRLDYVNNIVVGLLLVLFILFRPEGIIPEKKYVPKAKD